MKPASSVSAVLLLPLLISCARGGVPTAEDVPEILAEAQGTREVSKWNDSEARRAVRTSFKTLLYFDSLHESEVRSRFQRPELRSYLMLDDSYIGGDFPRRIALLLREVQLANQNYALQVASFPNVLSEKLATTELSSTERAAVASAVTRTIEERRQPVMLAVAAFDTFVQRAAQLYEVAAGNPGAFRSLRTGLEASDGRARNSFNGLVDQVNRAHDATDAAIRGLDPEQQAHFRRMGVASPVRR